MLKWKSSWNKSCRSRKTEQSWYSKVFHLTSGTVRKSQLTSFSVENHRISVKITEISVEITEISVGIHRNSVFWIWILFPFGISEIRRNFGRNFVSGKRRDSEKKRKGKPWSRCARMHCKSCLSFFLKKSKLLLSTIAKVWIIP